MLLVNDCAEGGKVQKWQKPPLSPPIGEEMEEMEAEIIFLKKTQFKSFQLPVPSPLVKG